MIYTKNINQISIVIYIILRPDADMLQLYWLQMYTFTNVSPKSKIQMDIVQQKYCCYICNTQNLRPF